MSNFVYRAQHGVKPGEDIVCKDPKSPITLFTFIKLGSNCKTKFISTTKLIGVASHKYAVNCDKGDVPSYEKRAQIIVADLHKMGEKIHNCSDDTHLREVKDDSLQEKLRIYQDKNIPDREKMAINQVFYRTKADMEIIAEDRIPAESYREIPPILVDVLDAFEQVSIPAEALEQKQVQKKHQYEDTRSQRTEDIMSIINEMIMKDGATDLIQAIGEMEFNPIESFVFSKYYGDRYTMHATAEMFQEYINGNEKYKKSMALDVVSGIRTGIIRKIMSNQKIQGILFDKMCEKNEIPPSEFMQEFIGIMKEAQESYAIPEGLASTTSKETKEEKSSFLVGPHIAINVNVDDRIDFPIGVELSEEQKSFIVKYRTLQRGKDSFGNSVFPHFRKSVSGKISLLKREVSINREKYAELESGIENEPVSIEQIVKYALGATGSRDVEDADTYKNVIQEKQNNKQGKNGSEVVDE